MLPQWKCHKVVGAAKILAFKVTDKGADEVILALDCGRERTVTRAWMEKHRPAPLGYFVEYGDGYSSYSPAAAFDTGYSRLDRTPFRVRVLRALGVIDREKALSLGFAQSATFYGIPVWVGQDGDGMAVATKWIPLEWAMPAVFTAVRWTYQVKALLKL